MDQFKFLCKDENFYILCHKDVFANLEDLINDGRLYIRANKLFKFNSPIELLNAFELSEKSLNQSVQKVTNCYDREDARGVMHTLDKSEFKGIFPCLKLTTIGKAEDETSIKRIKEQIQSTTPKSCMLFLSNKAASESEKDEETDKEITKMREFIENPKEFNNFSGLIKTDCKIPRLDLAAPEDLILPKYFKGIIVYIDKSYTTDDIFKGIIDILGGTDRNIFIKKFNDHERMIMNLKNEIKKKISMSKLDNTRRDRKEDVSPKRSRSHHSSDSPKKENVEGRGKKQRTRTKPKKQRTRTKPKKQRTRTKHKPKK